MAKVFYFQGTANTTCIAKKISQKIPDCELIKVTGTLSYNLEGDDVVGIVFPVFYYGVPEIVGTFMKNIQGADKSYLFVIVTKGVLFSRGVEKQLKKWYLQVAYFEYCTMGDNFDTDFWSYSAGREEKLKNKRSDKFVNKTARSIQDCLETISNMKNRCPWCSMLNN